MLDELDPALARLFARARTPLPDGEFIRELFSRIDRARRVRLWRQIAVVAAAVLIGALNMPLLLEKTAGVVRLAGAWAPTYADLLVTPWGWAVSGVVGAWMLFRTRPSRR